LLFGGFAGCSSSDDSQAVADSEEQLGAVGDAAEHPERLAMLSHLGLAGPMALREGFGCDDSPEVTTIEVCGHQVPSEIHLAWEGCSAPTSQPPPLPPFGGEPMEAEGDGCQDAPFDGPPPGMTSGPPGMTSGTVNVVNTSSARAGDCSIDTAVVVETHMDADIERELPDGKTMTLASSFDGTVQRSLEAKTMTRAGSIELTRQMKDGDEVLRGMHLTGTISVELDASAGPPLTTVSGALEIAIDGIGDAALTLVDVVHQPPCECIWPVSGTVELTRPDAGTHTLVFGPACGEATIDGNAVSLPSEPPPMDGPPAPGN
jgi:hypothetical protein